MTKPKKHIYFVPGMAANSSIFDYIQVPDKYQVHRLEWLVPLDKSESLREYATRMCAQIHHKNPILVGVSFGGVMVQEMKAICDPEKVIIISSVKTKGEMPLRMRFAQKTGAHKILPTSLLANMEHYEKYAFHSAIKKRLELYKKFLSMRDSLYLPWAIHTIVNWDRTEPDPDVIHIHGDNDFIFPAKNIHNCIWIPGGTHVMILTKAKKINAILQDIL